MNTKQEIKIMSLNVNGLGNPVKRARVITKLKREKAQICFLQETHLCKSEHEKLKKFGYKNAYYSSHTNPRKRGVVILFSNQIKFECHKEIKDKEGRYIIIKGIISETMVTLVNIYAPPESDKQFFKTLFDTITLESEGICWCAGDVNVVMDYDLDTTSVNKNKKHISKLVKNTWEEMGFVDVWRDLHPLQKDYSHYSQTHKVHSRIDYFYTQKENMELVQSCQIGVADVSDHNALYMKVCLSDKKRNTLWRLNVGLLNSEPVINQIKTDIENYLTENDNGETNPTIVWDALKAVIRGKLIAISSQIKKAKLERYKQLLSDLRKLEQKHNLKADGQTFTQILEVKKQINESLQREVEMKARYLKQHYYETGPRAAKLLARRLRKQQADRTVYKLLDPKTNKIKCKQEEIESIILNYYRELYREVSTPSDEDTRAFLDKLDLPSIGQPGAENTRLTANISIEEIQKAIGKFKTSKTPGSDGFPSEWYKKFETELLPVLHSTFNWVKEEGITPPSWKEAVITILPKPGKDKLLCQSYRPISLLNVDYKLYTSILSDRIQSFISDLTDVDQTGFITGRQTQDNIRRTLHVIHKIKKDKTPTALISLDAAQAFDKVSHKLTLERFGFDDKAIQCIKTLYTNPTARIKINGSLTDRFEIEQGCRQGCSLSPSLFALFIEPLAQKIRENIIGIEINGDEHVISLFADDVLIYLKNPLESFDYLMQTLDEFSSYSGYKLNKSKTQILMFNCEPNAKLKELNINWEAKSFKYLGINITKDLSKLYQSNYEDINKNIKTDIERWSTYPLGFSDRIHAIKMNVLPRLLYLFQSLPVPVPQTQFKIWDKLISRFIWDGKRPRIRYKTLQLPKIKGGLALPNLLEYFHAAQLRPLLNWCTLSYEAKWKIIETRGFTTPILTNLGERRIEKNVENEIKQHPIADFALSIWYEVIKQLRIGKELGLLKWIGYDRKFKPGQLDSRYEQWNHQGVTPTTISSLINGGEMESFQTLKDKFRLDNRDFFRYLQIRDYYNKEIKPTDGVHPIIKIFQRAYRAVTPRAISELYNCLMDSKKDSTTYVKMKWEKELEGEIPEEMWEDMWENHQTTTQSKGWREFAWKNQIRYFITPKIKSKQLKTPQTCWRECTQENPGHSHIFWNCPKITPMWDMVHKEICKIIGYKIPNTCLVLYLGHIEESVHAGDQYLVKILLVAAKKAITKNWLKKETPDYEQWRNLMDNIEEMERMTFRIRVRNDLYEKRWEKWRMYKTLRSFQ